jgi:hypothetical protein
LKENHWKNRTEKEKTKKSNTNFKQMKRTRHLEIGASEFFVLEVCRGKLKRHAFPPPKKLSKG